MRSVIIPDLNMNFDIQTIIILTAIAGMVMSIGMFVTAARYSQIKGITQWSAGCALFSVGWFLLGLRGEIPLFFSVVIANFAIVGSIAMFYVALVRFKDKEPHYSIVFSILAFFAVIFLFFTYVEPLYAMRAVMTSFIGSSITFYSGLILVSTKNEKKTFSEWLMAVGFFAISLAGLIRILSFGLHYGQPRPELFTPSLLHSLVFGLFFLAILILSFSFSLMITDRFRNEIMRLATLDSLTETYNRSAMEKLINKEIERTKRFELPLSFLLLDFDHFKLVNDSYGHQVGDLTLKEIVRVITSELREHDMLGRFGGEEFTILLPDTDWASAEIVAERIRTAVERSVIKAGESSFNITVSIGLASFEPEKDDFEALFRRADLGLYKAKQSGRNQVVAIRDQINSETYFSDSGSNVFKSNPSIEIPISVKQ